MQVSERDKKLLLLLLAVAVFCLPFFFVIQPLFQKNNALETQVAEAQEKNVDLRRLDEEKEFYLNEAQKYAVMREDIIRRFPEDLPQEALLFFLTDTEQKIPLSFYQAVYGQQMPASVTGEDIAQEAAPAEESASDEEAASAQAQAEAVDEAAGITADGGAGEPQTIVLSENMTGTVSTCEIIFSGKYENWKSFLEYLLTYQDRMVITSMDVTYSEEGGMVDGTFEMNQYALSGAGRAPVSVPERSGMYGTTNVFRQAAGKGSGAAQEEADFFLMLNPADADVEEKIFGRSGDASQASYLTNDSNQESEITIVFSGENGAYTATCDIGTVTYEDGGVSFSKDGSVNLEILSTQRLSDEDQVSGQIHLINNMDVTLGVTVSGDDGDNPRVNIRTREGAILMK